MITKEETHLLLRSMGVTVEQVIELLTNATRYMQGEAAQNVHAAVKSLEDAKEELDIAKRNTLG